jgi:hypothetical protein
MPPDPPGRPRAGGIDVGQPLAQQRAAHRGPHQAPRRGGRTDRRAGQRLPGHAPAGGLREPQLRADEADREGRGSYHVAAGVLQHPATRWALPPVRVDEIQGGEQPVARFHVHAAEVRARAASGDGSGDHGASRVWCDHQARSRSPVVAMLAEPRGPTNPRLPRGFRGRRRRDAHRVPSTPPGVRTSRSARGHCDAAASVATTRQDGCASTQTTGAADSGEARPMAGSRASVLSRRLSASTASTAGRLIHRFRRRLVPETRPGPP